MFGLYSQPKYSTACKVSKGLCPEIMKGLFHFRKKNTLQSKTKLPISRVQAVFSGTESIKLLDPKIGELMPGKMEEIESLWKFKSATKQWKPKSYPCRLCR